MLNRIIAPKALVSGHAMSGREQPYFESLVNIVRQAQKPLVIIAGAGVSMDAGLPSWAELVKRLEQRLVDESRREAFSALPPRSLERLTDTLLMLSGSTTVHAGNSHILASAIYSDRTDPRPGPLALALARLVAAYATRVSLITTNFDQVLEDAVTAVNDTSTSATPVRYSFSGWSDWLALEDEQHRKTVMHLHGLVYSETKSPEGPLVLSESDFSKHGPTIQRELISLIEGSHLLIVGASMNDRNIISALSEAKPSDDRYSLVTPALSQPGHSALACAEAATWEVNVLEEAVHLKSVIMKSFGQVSQAVGELALASLRPKEYARPHPGLRKANSLHYGTRFVNTLRTLYQSLGMSPTTGVASREDRARLSFLMHELVEGPNGPARVLGDLRRAMGLSPDGERIALFLWLRKLPSPRATGKAAASEESDFALNLVTSSAYVHWDHWSGVRHIPISATSSNAAAQAAFGGNPLFKDILIDQHSGHWQGAWAKPIFIARPVHGRTDSIPYDQLQIGAVAVNTTLPVSANDEMQPGDLSALAQLVQPDMDLFEESVDLVIDELLR